MVVMNNVHTTERLIQEVRSRPPLWDQKHLNYHNRLVVNTQWQEIADLLQVNKETVKIKWKGLRDTYRRELKKLHCNNNIQNNGENARDPSWIHYSSMDFLREYMGSNNNQNDIFQFQGWPTDEVTSEEPASPGEDMINSFMSASSVTDPVTSKANPVASASENEIGRSDIKTEIISPENKDSMINNKPLVKKKSISRFSKLKKYRLKSRMAKKHTKQLHNNATHFVTQEDSDDDLYFFKSLIPYVKSLAPPRKLYLRSEIHNLVLREIMTDSNGISHGVIPLEHVSVGLNA